MIGFSFGFDLFTAFLLFLQLLTGIMWWTDPRGEVSLLFAFGPLILIFVLHSIFFCIMLYAGYLERKERRSRQW